MQKPNLLKVVANSERTVLLSFKAGAYQSLISEGNPLDKGRGYEKPIKNLYIAYHIDIWF